MEAKYISSHLIGSLYILSFTNNSFEDKITQKDEQIVLRAYCLDLNWSLSYSNTLRIMTQRLNSAGQVKMDLWKIFTIVAWCREKDMMLESNRRTCFLILILLYISCIDLGALLHLHNSQL